MAGNRTVGNKIEGLQRDREELRRGRKSLQDRLDVVDTQPEPVDYGTLTSKLIEPKEVEKPDPYRGPLRPRDQMGDKVDVEVPKPEEGETEGDNNIASTISRVPKNLRREIWNDYKDEKRRIGWAQAAETIGHALTKYFAARQGVTGIETTPTNWADYLDVARQEYKQRSGELDNRDRVAEQNRLKEESMQLTRDVAEGKLQASEVNARKKEIKKEQDRIAKEANSVRKSKLSQLSARLKELSKLDDSEIDDEEEIAKLNLPPETRSRIQSEATEDAGIFDDYNPDKVRSIIQEDHDSMQGGMGAQAAQLQKPTMVKEINGKKYLYERQGNGEWKPIKEI